MFLNISQHILHVVLIWEVLVLLIMICTASVSMASRRELHVHYRLVGKVFLLLLLLLLLFRVVLRWLVVGGVAVIRKYVPIGKWIVVALSKLLLVGIDFVQFGAHLSIAATHLATEDVSSLCCSAWLTLDRSRSISVYLGNHLHLIRIIHNKLLGISSVSRCGPLSSIDYLALGSHSRNLVVVFLNGRKINRWSLLNKSRFSIVDRRFRLFEWISLDSQLDPLDHFQLSQSGCWDKQYFVVLTCSGCFIIASGCLSHLGIGITVWIIIVLLLCT